MYSKSKDRVLKAILLLAGAFTFAFLWGELVHDSGHYFCHLAYGNSWIKVHFDPFGSTRIIGASGLPEKVLAVTSLAGPLPNLILALFSFGLLWKFRRPMLLPFLLWGPVALVQEGVNFSLGLLTHGGDAFWISTLGIPQAAILVVGILALIAGIGTIALLLPLAGIREEDPFLLKWLVILVGMGSLMLIRWLYSFLVAPQFNLENLVPLIFSALLSILVVVVHRPIMKWTARRFSLETATVTWSVTGVALSLGVLMFLFQWFILN